MELIKMQTNAMKRDLTTNALCKALDGQVDCLIGEVNNVLIYPAIEALRHEILDELAWQFDVVGYSINLDISQKVNLIKGALKVHRYAGTAYAVKSALSSLYKNAWIEEWPHFGGEPYTFKALVNYQGDTKDDNMQSIQIKINDVIMRTKNVRSQLISIDFLLGLEATCKVGVYSTVATAVTILPYIADSISQNVVLKTGAQIKYANKIEIYNQGGVI